jgi:hypothetical protein
MADSTTWKSIFCGSFKNTELDNKKKICLMQLTQQQGNLYSLAHSTTWKSSVALSTTQKLDNMEKICLM